MKTPTAPPFPVTAVVFDMDGLLVDTEAAYFQAMRQAADELGRALSLDDFRCFVGRPSEASDAEAMRIFGPNFPLDRFNARTDELVQAIISGGLSLKPGVIELLDYLDEIGLPRAIATSSSHRAVEAHLGWSGLAPRFDAIIARGDYVHGKPHPDPYLKAAETLRVDPRGCLALEDSHNGIRSAAAAGMMSIMVPDMLEATAEMIHLCIEIAGDLHTVRAMLEVSWTGRK
jgi:HAD superfamily hydrolase (TIGR01509 family)